MRPLTVAQPTGESAQRWYAVYVRSRHEGAVETLLKGKGYSSFSPVCSVRKKRVDQTKKVDLPLFPGYVFCQFDASARLPILVTPGVLHVVGAGKRPLPVEEYEIDSLRAIAASGRPVQPWPLLKQGQMVRVEAGPLCGAVGKFLRMKNEVRLVVSVTLLQRAVSVELDEDSVSPAF